MKNQGRYLKIFALIILAVGFTSCQAQVDTSEFDKADDATSIEIWAHRQLLPQLVIDDPGKVSFAKEFVHKHAKNDNWEGPPLFSPDRPSFTFSINFLRNGKVLVWLGFEPPDTLVYFPYKKLAPKEDILLLIDTLDIPEEYTVHPE